MGKVSLVVMMMSMCAWQALGARARQAADAMEHFGENRNAIQCTEGAPARKKRNQCCHRKGGGEGSKRGQDAHACEAALQEGETGCEGGCFMIDRSKAGGRKMCKPICDAKRLVSTEDVENMKVEADVAAKEAAKKLKEVLLLENGSTDEEKKEAKAQDDAAQQRQIVVYHVADQFVDHDVPTTKDLVKKETKETTGCEERFTEDVCKGSDSFKGPCEWGPNEDGRNECRNPKRHPKRPPVTGCEERFTEDVCKGSDSFKGPCEWGPNEDGRKECRNPKRSQVRQTPEPKLTFQETKKLVKEEAVEACSDFPKDKRMKCCLDQCRARIEKAYPGENRNISPKDCATPCNNA